MTNGNRRPDTYYDRFIKPSGYRPRRRRTDSIVTALIGFAVGAALGVGFLAFAVVLVWLAEVLIGFLGFNTFLIGFATLSGTVLAVSAIRGRR